MAELWSDPEPKNRIMWWEIREALFGWIVLLGIVGLLGFIFAKLGG